MSMEDAQWLEARQFSVEEIARLFRVPPTIIGDLRHGNYSNSVEMNRVFVVHTLRRHMTMWEQAISSSLLTPAAAQVYFAEHSVEGLLRGDSTNRADFYSKGIADGWLLIDEVRKYENLPKLTDAERNQAAPAKPSENETGKKKALTPNRTLALNGAPWARLRRYVLSQQPLCVECAAARTY